MALIKMEGFDHQAAIADVLQTIPSPTSPFSWMLGTAGCGLASPGRLGVGKAASFGQYDYISGTTSFGQTELLVGVGVYVPAGKHLGIGFYDSGSQDPTLQTNISLDLNGLNGRVTVRRNGQFGNTAASGVVTLGQSHNNAFPHDAFFYIEIDALCNSGAGGVVVSVNGTGVLELTQLNTQMSALANIDSVIFGCHEGVDATGCQIDDFYLCDVSAGPGPNAFNDFQGPVQIYTLFPTGNGPSIGFSHTGAATNWQAAGEAAMDGDTSYNSTTVVGSKDLFTFDPMPAGLFPFAVAVRTAQRSAVAGTHNIRTSLVSGAGETLGDPITCGTSYEYFDQNFPFNPSISDKWSEADVDALEMGYVAVS